MQKHDINENRSLTFFIILNLLLYVRIKSINLDVGLYPLHAHDLKCNVNILTPKEITFCLADT